ncbi:MarR family winged helix-turn-helix transcriptional regulator [Bordetella genomosp. 13]|uniref:MarR family winged helix-turn-helix transcriptional regulator n=1 Tax=Bordetella genomosp. 13 TaxID=463040 RepID=UPI0021B6B08B|nr:MarR family winged helix-turn-helix transcriptional regulator [Bordetella genomosp. 13]
MPSSPHSSPRLSPSDYELLAQFRRGLREFISFSESAAAEMGLAPQQHQALLAIKGTPGRDGLYIGEIAERLMIKPHTAAELVTRLVRMDLAQRLPDPADGRRVQVVLTAHAEGLLEDLSVAHLEELRGIRPLLARLLDRFDDSPRQGTGRAE